MLERKNPLNLKNLIENTHHGLDQAEKDNQVWRNKVKKILHWSTVKKKKKVNKHYCIYYIPVCGYRDQT